MHTERALGTHKMQRSGGSGIPTRQLWAAGVSVPAATPHTGDTAEMQMVSARGVKRPGKKQSEQRRMLGVSQS